MPVIASCGVRASVRIYSGWNGHCLRRFSHCLRPALVGGSRLCNDLGWKGNTLAARGHSDEIGLRKLPGFQSARQASSATSNVDADVVIRNGRVIDPANEIDDVCDVAIKDGRVAAIGHHLTPNDAASDVFFDATDCIVTPGLIDFQVSAYQYCTPLGVNIDDRCLRRGVTTAIDSGSAGARIFAGLRKFIAEPSKTRMYAFLHVAAQGMAAAGTPGFGIGGECDTLCQIDPELCVECIKENEDLIVGVKVRLHADVCGEGRHEDDAFRGGLLACQQSGLPLLTPHSFSTIPTEVMPGTMGVPASLRPGDIYTNAYHGYHSTIINPATQTILENVHSARQRGVYFDVGHGEFFTWTVAEICARQDFYPDIISTLLDSATADGPVYDLVTVMTKMLYLGMPLTDVIKAVTATPAKAINRDTLIGSLGVGRVADVTVLREDQVNVALEDSHGQLRTVTRKLEPVAVWKDGEQFEIVEHAKFPNTSKLQELREPWEQLLIRDAAKPGGN